MQLSTQAPTSASTGGDPVQGTIAPRQRLGRRLKIAVDVDEVLGRFVHSLNQYCREHHGKEYEVSDYFQYNFAEVWQCSQEVSHDVVHSFFKSHHFEAIQPIPGALESLRRLQHVTELVVVTSRQNVIRSPTLAWVETHFPAVFSGVHFGNHWAIEGVSQSKVDMCRKLGADVLVDDNPVYAEECAAAGVHVLLFDWMGGYPWASTPRGPDHPLITRVHDWEAVERTVAALRPKLGAA